MTREETRREYGKDLQLAKELAGDTVRAFPWVKVALVLIALSVGLSVLGLVCTAANDAASTAQRELSASTLLAKYSWLKEAHAQLDKKVADIAVYKKGLSDLASSYGAGPRTTWAREDRDAYNLRATELLGITASYNDLAAQYNAKMAEVQWRFTNVGTLPQGATEPLPREYVPYRSE
jgi:hypothetical protein